MVLDVENNQLGGTLSNFAFQAAANRADLHSALRYFDIGNNSFAGECIVNLQSKSYVSSHALQCVVAISRQASNIVLSTNVKC